MTGEDRIEWIELDALKEWPGNPRSHDTKFIAKSIGRFGFMGPPRIDETTGRLVAGHGRIRTLVKLRDAGQPVPRGLRVLDGKWYVPVLRGVAFESEAEAKAFLLADNEAADRGGWDEDARRLMQLALAQEGFPVEQFSWDFATGSDEPSPTAPDAAAAAEALAKKWGVHVGQLWEIPSRKLRAWCTA